MRVALLTSSRADYGIYLPLLKKLAADPFFELKIIAFGTHLSHFHGYTLKQIQQDGFEVYKTVESLVLGDSPEAISSAIGLTQLKFASIWAEEKDKLDLIISLGDRYEMFAAVMAAIPFNIPVAHLHGGETTLGAIDNTFRHAITLASQLHFTSTETHAARVKELTGQTGKVYNVGALSLDNMQDMQLLSQEKFRKKFGIDISIPSVLVTFHPETVSFEANLQYTDELIAALKELDHQIIITMPNADTMGSAIRQKLLAFAEQDPKVKTVESFGTLGYFSCMQHCSFLIGNTSSGIIEAASFGKYVINVGDRQLGREGSANVFHCPVEKNAILEVARKIESLPAFTGENIYGAGNSATKIIAALKQK
jgi:GDP/UDP-N,N'-diacetylbacillosamine 2-epimerase (hydrolysing)